ncbi:DUF674 family protein [Spatholobus suberectus]|nr:DUF674 family protein [Spatholobus suberectus]
MSELDVKGGGQMMKVRYFDLATGGAEHILNGNSYLGSIDNLYKTMLDLDCSRYLWSPDLKDMLVKTPLAYQFILRNKILQIDEVLLSN